MKVNDSGCIQNSEKDFIGALCKGFNWQAIHEVFKERYNLRLLKAEENRQGDIVLFNEQIAYKLGFNATVPLSIFFDRQGNYLALTPADEDSQESDAKSAGLFQYAAPEPIQDDAEQITAYDLLPFEDFETLVVDASLDPEENISQMADRIAAMIADINTG